MQLKNLNSVRCAAPMWVAVIADLWCGMGCTEVGLLGGEWCSAWNVDTGQVLGGLFGRWIHIRPQVFVQQGSEQAVNPSTAITTIASLGWKRG